MFASAFSSVLIISELTDPSVDDKSDDCFNMPKRIQKQPKVLLICS